VQWLRQGSVEPLLDCIGTGDITDPILSMLALMFMPNPDFPYYAALHRRPGKLGASPRPGRHMRDAAAAMNYEAERKAGASHAQALQATAAEFGMTEPALAAAVTRLRKMLQALDSPTINKS
jgi:hypothetical protein